MYNPITNSLRVSSAVCIAMLGALALSVNHAGAQIVAPSTYTTAIHVQGEAAGAEFDDWASSGIPAVVTDASDNPGDLDIKSVQVANDNDFIYIHATTYSETPIALVNLFLAFDNDQNKATGFDVLQIGQIGSEVGYQTDYPFAQYSGVFNLNISLTGGPLNNGGALIYPYWLDNTGPHGTQIEWAVPRAVTIQYPPALGGPGPTFPNPSFDFVIYTPDGLGDITDTIRYTLAMAPGKPGDFNGDSLVDGRDFLAWQRGFGITSGATLSQGDADGNGAVNAVDLGIWKSHVGAATVAAVGAPEPSSLWLGAISIAALARRCGFARHSMI
jgi:hypothetical protein